MRRYYLPNETDDAENLARAAWLDNHFAENMRFSIANGITLAFNGK
ncbi:DUF6890 family protein [Pragia fontium]